MDNIYQLKVFVLLCKTLNFTETAKQMQLAQPAVSRYIKALESELGRTLFVREQKKVLLTEAGKNLLIEISPLLSEFERIFSEYNDNKYKPVGTIKIGSITEAGSYIYMNNLIEFQNTYPDIKIIIEYGGSDFLQKKVSNGEIDFALVSRFSENKSIEAKPLFKDMAILVGSKSKKNENLDLAILPFIQYREDDYYTEDFLKRNFTPQKRKKIRTVACVSSHESMMQWAINRDAFCVVPYSSYNNSKYKSQLEIFIKDDRESVLSLIYLYNAKAEFRKKLFLQQMQKITLANSKSN